MKAGRFILLIMLITIIVDVTNLLCFYK